MNAATSEIDGFGPLPVVQPHSVAEVADRIHQAAAAGTALYPMGGRTTLALGNPPSKPGAALDLRALDRIIDFPARDMTITVQAGITIARLREITARENLCLPIDVPLADRATVGGVIAANISGPRRFGYGTLRDYVIGITALNDEGCEFKAGGRVVKNVAGYDLCKLLVGSLGTLGIITQATLKLRPLAEQQAAFIIPCEADQLETVVNTLHSTRTRPTCFELLNRSAAQVVFRTACLTAPEEAWLAIVGFEGNPDAVGWQVQQLVKELGPLRHLLVRLDFTALPLCHALVEFAAAEHPIAFKANLLPSAIYSFCLAADADGGPVRAHAGNGIVVGQWPASLTKDAAARILNLWRERASGVGPGSGNVILTRCPSTWKTSLSVWGPPPNDAWLMRQVKAKFDPKGIFNPGRFVDGI